MEVLTSLWLGWSMIKVSLLIAKAHIEDDSDNDLCSNWFLEGDLLKTWFKWHGVFWFWRFYKSIVVKCCWYAGLNWLDLVYILSYWIYLRSIYMFTKSSCWYAFDLIYPYLQVVIFNFQNIGQEQWTVHLMGRFWSTSLSSSTTHNRV